MLLMARMRQETKLQQQHVALQQQGAQQQQQMPQGALTTAATHSSNMQVRQACS
jgi:hypothetical protein